MKTYLKIQIEISSAEEMDILVGKLSAINFYAFDEENNLLNAYVNEEDFDQQKLKDILPAGVTFTKDIIEEENWNAQWESQVKPVLIKDFVAIRPGFSPAIKNVKHDLIITPKMSFGTGHHATTHLMIELMENIDFKNKRVVDFGTGTGVLAILAEKCGSPDIEAVDYDEWSIENASENVQANDCLNIKLKQQDNLSEIDSADIILANINLNVLKEQSFSLADLSNSEALLMVSGFLTKDEKEVQEIFEAQDFVKLKSKEASGWLAMVFQKK